MSTAITVTYLISFVFLVLGIGVWYKLYTDDSANRERGQFKYLLIVPAFAALSYAIMATGFTTVTVDGTDVYVFRYIDWLVTTPILVAYIGWVAGAPKKWIYGVAGADAMMILVGGVAVALTGIPKWVAFTVSAGFHLSLLYVLYVVFPKYAAEYPERNRLFKILQNHVGLLWLAYPLVWLLSPVGIDSMGVVGTAMIIAYLDAIAKTPYVYFVYRERHCFDESRTAARAAAEDPTSGSAGVAAD